jgi:hypothetical protein
MRSSISGNFTEADTPEVLDAEVLEVAFDAEVVEPAPEAEALG